MEKIKPKAVDHHNTLLRHLKQQSENKQAQAKLPYINCCLAQLRSALFDDRQAVLLGLPAVRRLILLRSLVRELAGQNDLRLFCDNQGPEILSQYLSILPDGHYPCVDIVSEVLLIAERLPITRTQIIKSRLGKSILTVIARTDLPLILRRQADILARRWTLEVRKPDDSSDDQDKKKGIKISSIRTKGSNKSGIVEALQLLSKKHKKGATKFITASSGAQRFS